MQHFDDGELRETAINYLARRGSRVAPRLRRRSRRRRR